MKTNSMDLAQQLTDVIQSAIVFVSKKEQWPVLGYPRIILTRPKQHEHGDYSTNITFALAAKVKKSPMDLAVSLAPVIEQIAAKNGVRLAKVEAAAGYINFYLDPLYFVDVVNTVLKKKEKFGYAKAPVKQKIIVEYSQPNIAKIFSMGNLRSTIIGESLARLIESQGHKVIRFNYLGDWGTHLGKLIVAYKKWGNEKSRQALRASDPINYLRNLYIDFSAAAEKEESLVEEARRAFQLLESGDKQTMKYWKEFLKLSEKEFSTVYKTLKISFDVTQGESVAAQHVDRVFNELRVKGLLKESEGALVVDLASQNLPTALLKKSDGTTLYLTRDVASALLRYDRFGFDRMIYQVDARQALHFKQLFALMKMLGYGFAAGMSFSAHGLYRVNGQVMASRKGHVVLLKDVFREARERALKIIEEKNPTLRKKKATAEMIAIGAVRFNDLMTHKESDVQYDVDRAVNLQGKSGPYIQYTNARLRSILRKAKTLPRVVRVKASPFTAPEEIALTNLLALYPKVVAEAAKNLTPHLVAEHIYSVAQTANSFYNSQPVLAEKDTKVRAARLALVAATSQVLQNGLSLLGIEAPQEM